MNTKIKTIQPLGNTIACKGKFILVKSDKWEALVFSTNKYGGIFRSEYYSPMKDMGDYYISPIIISETEDIERGDYCYDTLTKSLFQPRNTWTDTCKKVIAISENFSSEILRDIVDGKLKDRDEVMVECERVVCKSASGGVYAKNEYKIKLTDNFVTIIPDKKEIDIILIGVGHHDGKETWDEIFEYLDVHITEQLKETYLAVRDELKRKYNPPTRKNK